MYFIIQAVLFFIEQREEEDLVSEATENELLHFEDLEERGNFKD